MATIFGEKFIGHIKNTVPELYRPDICVARKSLPLQEYDRINALIIRNSLLSEEKEGIAIFNPPSVNTNISLIVAAGLACYKAALGRTPLSENDLVPGSLVFYQGELVRFERFEEDPSSPSKRIVLANEDKHRTRTIISIDKLPEISIYSGSRTTPDIAGARTRTPAIQKVSRWLLGLAEEQQMQLAGCSSIIVCLPEASLLDVLKKTTINGLPFFDLFPSVRWTPGGEQRLGRDHKKRNPVFYFVGSLSSADDVLGSDAGRNITTLICDGQRALRSASLISSMRSDYSLQKSFIIDEVSNVESMPKLEKLGFQIWAWRREDFVDTSMEEEPITVEIVPYPASFSLEAHRKLQECISRLHRISRMQESQVLKEFLVSAYGLSNTLFQAPVSANTLSDGTPWNIKTHFDNLAFKAAHLRGQLPSNDISTLEQLVNFFGQAVQALSSDKMKYETILKIIRGIPAKSTSIAVKRANVIAPLETQIAADLFTDLYSIISSPKQISLERNVLVWTFRPDLRRYAESVLKVHKSIFVGYAQQIDELRAVENQYNRIVASYSGIEARSRILKINPALFDSQPDSNAPSGNIELEEFTGLEELLLTSSTLARPYDQKEIDEGSIVPVVQVAFVGGFTAFIEPGRTLKVIGFEEEDMIQKTAAQLQRGDKVIFLKDERNTIFDELVEYYGHKQEVVEILKISEAWRSALHEYQETKGLTTLQIRNTLEEAGLERTELSIDNWLKGKVICPPEDDYRPIDIIAQVTGNTFLIQNKERVKAAARKVHSMRIKIGRYLAKRIVQSAVAEEILDGDPQLEQKLDKVSAYAEIAEVAAVAPDEVGISPGLANRLLGVEDF